MKIHPFVKVGALVKISTLWVEDRFISNPPMLMRVFDIINCGDKHPQPQWGE